MEINLLGISGSPVSNGNCDRVMEEALSIAGGQDGVQTEFVGLAKMEISGCRHCNWCVKNQTEENFCILKDDMNALYPKFLWADGVFLVSPVHIGRLSGMMANMLDRLRAFVHGNVHGGRLRNKVGGAIAVAFVRGGGVETTLLSLQAVFHVFNMIPARSRSYHLGAACLTSTEGKGRIVKGVRHMALEDKFGMESVKSLSERVLELARIIKAGRQILDG